MDTQQPSVTMVQVSADHADHSDSGVFVPPLQAKIELLKKSVGVDSVYDNQGGDELTRMKQMAGLGNSNLVAQDEAASDEPLDV
jgi:NADPH:quinone reductase-like Zn-dependent oxidoreductase